jgi:hypothetical protein
MNLRFGILLVITTLLASCSVVQKNGYYQSRKYNPTISKLKKAKPSSLKEKTVANKTYSELSELENEIAINVSAIPEVYPVFEEIKTTTNANTIADAKATKRALTKTVVKHKISQSAQQIIKHKTQNPTYIKEDNPPKEEPILAYIALGFVFISLILSQAAVVVGIGLLTLAAMILGFIAHKQHKENPTRFKNTWAITLAYVFSWIYAILIALVILYYLFILVLLLLLL